MLSNQAVRRVGRLLSALSLLVLGACGGGGGGGSSAPNTYPIGGSVSGLASGESVVLQGGSAGSATVSASGTFSFPTQLSSGSAYSVTVATQPATQTCTVAAGTGTVQSAAVTTVAVTCVTNAYAVSGTVSGLGAGVQVVLENNGGDATTVAANGAFAFPTPVAQGTAYAVTVQAPPVGQSCSVQNGTGTMAGTPVTNVQVVCGARVHPVAGHPATPGTADGTGAAAGFSGPYAVAVDASGNVYVADGANSTIRKISPAGVVTTLAGTAGVTGHADGAGATASFNNPAGIAVDPTGTVYVADTRNNTIRKVSAAGVVTTLAGTAGVIGSADGAGAAASFTGPAGLAVDSSGTVYVADSGNNTIRAVSAAGVVTTLAGTAGVAGFADGTGAAARFNIPNGVARDASGNLYVADTNSNTIRKISPAGIVTTLAGTGNVAGHADGTGAAATFSFPDNVAVDSAGNVYVADIGNKTIRKITPGGVVTTLAGTAGVAGHADGTGAAASFLDPVGVAVDASGNVYVADTGNNTIRKVSPAGEVTTLAGTAAVAGHADGTGAAASFTGPAGLAVDSSGTVYVADVVNNTIRAVSAAGVVTTLAGAAGVAGFADGTGAAASFYNPNGLARDASGNLYVADTQNNTIRKISPAGVVTTLAGTVGGPGHADGTGAAARFGYPWGVAVDSVGNVYVADMGTETIRKVSAAGVVTTLAGTPGVAGHADGTGAVASFRGPSGLAVDSSGIVYVADTDNNTIRKVSPAGVVTTLAGTAGVKGHTDGTGAAATFNRPFGITVDASGDLYVGDSGNGTIRKVSPAGVVTTVAGLAGQTSYIPDGPLTGPIPYPRFLAVSASHVLYFTAGNGLLSINPAP